MTTAIRFATSLSAAAALATPVAAPAADLPASARAHVRRTGTVAVAAPLERAFPLFTPLGERLWAPGWDPRPEWPADGEARAGTVFTTVGEDGRQTIWMIVDWDPAAHRVRYARVTPGVRTGTVEVSCAATSSRTTVATVTYELTALSADGDADLAGWTAAWYEGFLAEWQQQIAAALQPGEK